MSPSDPGQPRAWAGTARAVLRTRSSLLSRTEPPGWSPAPAPHSPRPNRTARVVTGTGSLLTRLVTGSGSPLTQTGPDRLGGDWLRLPAHPAGHWLQLPAHPEPPAGHQLRLPAHLGGAEPRPHLPHQEGLQPAARGAEEPPSLSRRHLGEAGPAGGGAIGGVAC